MGLHTEIDKIATEHPDAEPRELAATLIRRLKRTDLIDLLADEIAHRQRANARDVERTAFNTKFATNTRTAPTATPNAYRALFAATFSLGDRTTVTWGDATRDDHLRRIAMLEKLRDGIDRTINQHRQAVRLIDQHGVNCLGAIPAEAETLVAEVAA